MEVGMDEKTEELRDIFMDVSEEGTVTETQAETRGSLTDRDEDVVEERLAETVGEMRDRYDFATDFDTAEYVTLIREFYEEATDERLADRLDRDRTAVFAARMDLHLLQAADTDAPLEVCELRQRADADAATLAAEFDVDTETIRHYRRVVAAEDEARAANFRYRSTFDELLADADLAGGLTDAATRDGLEEAAEDIETDVSF
jgi:DNA-binding transcriptional MerR regulator